MSFDLVTFFKSSKTLASVFLKYLFMGLNVVESWFVEAQHKLLGAAGAETLRNMQFDNWMEKLISSCRGIRRINTSYNPALHKGLVLLSD